MPRISEAEWLVMRVLWERQKATAKDVVAALETQTTWKPKTVLTLLNRLVKKGALGFTKDGRAYLYHPKLGEQECTRAASRSFVERVFGGAVSPMLAHFVQEASLSSDEIAELRRILDAREAQTDASCSAKRSRRPPAKQRLLEVRKTARSQVPWR
jgi:BlaI family penicillinase repressor